MGKINQLSFDTQGVGRPVIFLHGFLASSKMWADLLLPDNHKAIFIDLPGHGKSNAEDTLCDTMEEMAAAVSEVADHLGLKSFDVIGHSMGGYVALALKTMDKRCSKVMLMNSSFWEDSPAKKIDRIRVANIVKTNHRHFIYEVIPRLFIDPEINDLHVKELIKDALKMTPIGVVSSSIAMSKRINQKHLLIECPQEFTILQGDQDPIVNVDQMINALGHTAIKLVLMKDVGHMAHIESPSALEGFVKKFLVPVVVENPN
ncbi:MAG: pimeloyl-ACP methyl ester carboxylesterase [Flavobacteriaceae bacterium]|jgi:pimeloyl-ACP methyl ester carboxylesterase